MKSLLCPTFIFCYLWAIGGNLNCTYWESFDNFIKKQFEENRNAKVETHTHTQPKLKEANMPTASEDRKSVV